MGALKVGDKITIRWSKRLAKNGNGLLVGRVGTVTRVVVSGGAVSGAYVDVTAARRVRNFYIPVVSIEDSDEINRMRNLSILKTTIL